MQFLTNHKEKIKSAYREGHCPCVPRDYSPCRIGSKVAPLCGEGITCPRAWQRYKVRHPKGLTIQTARYGKPNKLRRVKWHAPSSNILATYFAPIIRSYFNCQRACQQLIEIAAKFILSFDLIVGLLMNFYINLHCFYFCSPQSFSEVPFLFKLCKNLAFLSPLFFAIPQVHTA